MTCRANAIFMSPGLGTSFQSPKSHSVYRNEKPVLAIPKGVKNILFKNRASTADQPPTIAFNSAGFFNTATPGDLVP